MNRSRRIEILIAGIILLGILLMFLAFQCAPEDPYPAPEPPPVEEPEPEPTRPDPTPSPAPAPELPNTGGI